MAQKETPLNWWDLALGFCGITKIKQAKKHKNPKQTNKDSAKKKKVKAHACLIQCFTTRTANSDEFIVNKGSLALHIQNTILGCQKPYSPSDLWVTDAVFPLRREIFLHAWSPALCQPAVLSTSVPFFHCLL